MLDRILVAKIRCQVLYKYIKDIKGDVCLDSDVSYLEGSFTSKDLRTIAKAMDEFELRLRSW